MSTTPIRFVAHHDVSSFYDFPGAGPFVGGYEAGDVAGFPADAAADLIARGIAVAATPSGPAQGPADVPVKLTVQQPFTFAHCDYLPGDVGGFPRAFATDLIAAGKATAA